MDPVTLALIGGSIASAFLGSKASKAAEPTMSQDEQRLLGKTEKMADSLGGAGLGLFDASKSAFGPAQSYFERLLGGSRDSQLEAISPQVGTVLSQYDTAKRAAMQFAPRGGGRNSVLAQNQFGQLGDIQRLLAGVRPSAAENLRNMGSQLGYMGLGATGQASGDIANVLSAILRKGDIAAQNARSAGSGFGQLAATLLGAGLNRIPRGGGGGGGGMDWSSIAAGIE